MGSPLGPALANIFVGFHESRLFDNTVKPVVYFRYVDDTFVIFSSELDCDCCHEKLNLLHPALNFTVEKGAKQLLELCRRFGGKRGHWISHQRLQEANVYRAIHPLEFLQPKIKTN